MDLITEIPLALIHDDGKHFTFLWANTEYVENLNSMGFASLAETEIAFNDPEYSLCNAMRRFIQIPIASGKRETVDFMNNNNYLRFSLRTVANDGDIYVHAASILNLSKDMNFDKVTTIY
ncbi:MAG: hypothetical protein II566_07240 [Lachnospiraceae bacterium]|nr:hypothetical protein [Lachnospiraceae bacterium]